MISQPRRALTLYEMLAAITIIGVFAALVMTRFGTPGTEARRRACEANRRSIEVQCRLWNRTKGTWPAANLGDIGANATYFPEGLPTCPFDGSSYTFSSATGTVTGHSH